MGPAALETLDRQAEAIGFISATATRLEDRINRAEDHTLKLAKEQRKHTDEVAATLQSVADTADAFTGRDLRSRLRWIFFGR